MNNEIWKDIKGYEGRYQISNYGRVKSLARVLSNNRPVPERILCGGFNKNYMHVILHKDGGKKRVLLIHRLVAEAFIPNPENKPCVNHIDGDKLNNSVGNLEWCTFAENTQHGYRTGLLQGQDGGNHTPVDVWTVKGEFVGTFESQAMAARVLCINTGNIQQVLKGHYTHVKGYTLKYHKEDE